MRRTLAALGGAVALAIAVAVPAGAVPGTGALMASFHAGFTGGEAIFVNDGQAVVHASPNPDTPGRLSPFVDSTVCDQQLVGSWFYGFGDDKNAGDIYEVVSYTLDGEELDVVETTAKPIALAQDFWWIAAGAPVIGVLEPGLHVIHLVVDVLGEPLEFEALVDVDAAHC